MSQVLMHHASIIVLGGGVAFFFASIAYQCTLRTPTCFAELPLSLLMNPLARITSGTIDAGHWDKYVVVCLMRFLSACRPIPDMFGKIFGQLYSMIY